MNKNNSMSWEGLLYMAPSVNVFNVHVEGVLCASGDYSLGGGGVYDDGDINDNGEY